MIIGQKINHMIKDYYLLKVFNIFKSVLHFVSCQCVWKKKSNSKQSYLAGMCTWSHWPYPDISHHSRMGYSHSHPHQSRSMCPRSLEDRSVLLFRTFFIAFKPVSHFGVRVCQFKPTWCVHNSVYCVGTFLVVIVLHLLLLYHGIQFHWTEIATHYCP